MAYTNYNFYTNKYFGDVIPESDFPRVAERASEKVDYYTFSNIDEKTFKDKKLCAKVKKAVCAVAEIIYKMEQIDALSGVDGEGKGKVISSESAGDLSVSYVVGKSVLERSVEDAAGIEEEIRKEICLYLSGTGLLYAGIG